MEQEKNMPFIQNLELEKYNLNTISTKNNDEYFKKLFEPRCFIKLNVANISLSFKERVKSDLFLVLDKSGRFLG